MSANNISKEAYKEIQASGKSHTQMNLILNHLILHGSKTRRQLSKALDMETSTISARVNKLKELNYVSDSKTTICPLSKVTVGLVEVCYGE